MRKYYVSYGEFANTYSLRYSESKEQDKMLKERGFERITRDEAIRLARREAERRLENPSSSGFADKYIYPAEHNGLYYKERNGYIVIK